MTIWDAENGKKLKEFNDNQAIISSLEFSPNGALLALGSYDQKLLIIDSKVKNIYLHKINFTIFFFLSLF